MHTLHTLLRFYPYWALPVALIVAELAWHFRRRRNSVHFFLWPIAGVFAVTSILWVAYRGDLHSDAWVRSLF